MTGNTIETKLILAKQAGHNLGAGEDVANEMSRQFTESARAIGCHIARWREAGAGSAA